jgi:hypothetical protein
MSVIRRIEGDKESQLHAHLDRCKNLGRVIKAKRVPSLVSLELGKYVPAQEVADQLIDAYLRTFETVHRIVHVPTFQAEYHRYWGNPQAASQSFIILMQLCMAVGACFYDDTYSYRSLATRWVYEAMIWLIAPPEKSRMNIVGIQVMCLVHFARQTAGIGADLIWISAGSLVRTAMYMGLHRDPSSLPAMHVFCAEMRRRLWASILEIILQSSIDAGGPPFISLDDFDTKPPMNINDSDLDQDANARAPTSKSMNIFTQTSVQIAMLDSFPIRLAVAKLVNDVLSNASCYDETLRLTAELTAACRSMRQRFARFPNNELGVLGTSTFAFNLAELHTYRFFLALHLPFLAPSSKNPAYYFSRKTCLDTALKLARLAKLGSQVPKTYDSGSGLDFIRLITGASGEYRMILLQATLTVALDLLQRKEEERNNHDLSVDLGGAELRSVLDGSLEWTASRIRAGETNIKGLAFHQTALAQIDAIGAGLEDAEVEAKMFEAAINCMDRCYELLKEVAGVAVDEEQHHATTEASDFFLDGADSMDILTGWDWEEVVS